jgi:hypothetical protein
MTKDKALKLAKAALENNKKIYKYEQRQQPDIEDKALAAIEEALAQPEQPEQEPVTEWLVCPKCSYKSPYSPIKAKTLAEDAERITKQARAALAQQDSESHLQAVSDFGQLQAQPEQEPVDVETVYETIIKWDEGGGKRSRRELTRRIVELYTSPPKREWVGLTRVQADDMLMDHGFDADDESIVEMLGWFEAKLKEKNT